MDFFRIVGYTEGFRSYRIGLLAFLALCRKMNSPYRSTGSLRLAVLWLSGAGRSAAPRHVPSRGLVKAARAVRLEHLLRVATSCIAVRQGPHSAA